MTLLLRWYVCMYVCNAYVIHSISFSRLNQRLSTFDRIGHYFVSRNERCKLKLVSGESLLEMVGFLECARDSMAPVFLLPAEESHGRFASSGSPVYFLSSPTSIRGPVCLRRCPARISLPSCNAHTRSRRIIYLFTF